jgi:chemotaxis protein histidine kinase CheA
MVSGQFPSPDSNPIDLAELQLQQELRAMFEVDSQQYLHDYLNLVQQLQPQSWTHDIQEIYRLIHTIKGSSVTVGADAILRVATVLEDLLSDLRHLNPAPPLADGNLSQILLEAGELLAGSLQVSATGDRASTIVKPSVDRLQALRERVKQAYLPEWNEQSLLHQEFAEQGFDLVVLDLEMALEKMPQQGKISSEIIDIAGQTLGQLAEIGKDLQLDRGWVKLLALSEDLICRPLAEIWRTEWTSYLKALKESARQGGKFVEPAQFLAAESTTAIQVSETESDLVTIDESLLADIDELENLAEISLSEIVLEEANIQTSETESDLVTIDESLLTDIDELENLAEISLSEIVLEEANELSESDRVELNREVEELSQVDLSFFQLETQQQTSVPEITSDLETSEDWLGLVSSPPNPSDLERPAELVATTLEPKTFVGTNRSELETNSIQIPVPLNRLDRTAQSLVDTLLTARASQGLYRNLQTQLTQLFALAQENAQYITRLRQLQDDYALVDSLKNTNNGAEGVNLERYRQGYTTINRLLETSLRLSELGAEAQKTTISTADSLQNLELNLLSLRQNVEQTRLVPFKNLGFRARAILRDLTNRFGKPARLTIEGEQIELDAGTSSKLEPILLHLIRNAFDHGLESSEERSISNKPATGQITLSLTRKGNNYVLEVGDDGKGIDAGVICALAKAKGLPLTSATTPEQLLAVISQPGFSSKEAVSDISGRGVGMDVVAQKVASLGGRLILMTEPGIGTIFQVRLPVPHLLVSCVLVQAGNCTFAIPTQDITSTTILDSLEASQVSDSSTFGIWKIEQGETTFLGLDLFAYWQPQASRRSLPDTAICMYIRPAGQVQGIWLLADELLEQTELLVTPLPSPLVAPIGILGVSLQPNGSLIPAIEAATIAEVLLQSADPTSEQIAAPTLASETSAAPILPEPEKIAQLTRTILVVDDAALMRRRIEASLTAYGYGVKTCADGQEAWNWLSTNPPVAMVITDIEMPNMDGFTLIDRARQSGLTMPMVVVSSRLAEEWSKEARRLGATDYLTKGFSTPELINKVKSLLG